MKAPHGALPFTVLVADNYDYQSAAYVDSHHPDIESALAQCRDIVDRCLAECHQPGESAQGLFETYKLYGDDPYLEGSDTPAFSAWDYARLRALVMCANDGEAVHPAHNG